MLPTVAILAGGLATRLRPVSETIPKSLLSISGRPFILHQLALLKRRGISRVVVCVGHLGDQIESLVRDGMEHGLSVSYSHDGPELLGTGGALRKAADLLDREFFVLYGDSYLECDYAAAISSFRSSNKLGLMTVYRNEDDLDRSNVEMRDGRIVAYNKRAPTPEMRHIDYGLGILSQGALKRLPLGGRFDLADLYGALVLEGQMAALEMAERFFDIGSFEGIRALERHLLVEDKA